MENYLISIMKLKYSQYHILQLLPLRNTIGIFFDEIIKDIDSFYLIFISF